MKITVFQCDRCGERLEKAAVTWSLEIRRSEQGQAFIETALDLCHDCKDVAQKLVTTRAE